MLIINFKTYENGTGKKGYVIAKKIDSFAKKSKTKVAIAVQAADIYRISKDVKTLIFAQHADPINPGKSNGYISLESLKEAGAKGVLNNHSEHLMNTGDIEFVINKCKKLNLISVVCASDPWIAEALVKFRPDYIAVEPPELIGGNMSVSRADPQIITMAVSKVSGKKNSNKVLIGAGIQDSKDVSRALALGAEGVLVSFSVMNSKTPEKVVKELLNGFK